MTPPAFRSVVCLLSSIGVLAALSACQTAAVAIEYEEAATFSEFKASPNSPAEQAGAGLFVEFRITSIKNPQDGPQVFGLIPNKMYVNTTPHGSYASGSIGPFNAQVRNVPHGMTDTQPMKLILWLPGDRNEIAKADNYLLYESQAGESVLLLRKQPSAPKKALSPATPQNLP